jgi:hypothetical protein
MFKDVRMCECIVCMKEKLIKKKRVASGHQTPPISLHDFENIPLDENPNYRGQKGN